MNDIEIKLSKKKTVFLFLGSLAFVLIGIFLIVFQAETDLPFLFVVITGVLCIAFFGYTGLYSLKQLFNKEPGFIINSKGIVDLSSGVCAGFISWEDIIEINRSTFFNQEFIVVKVNNPEKYIDKVTSPIKKKAVIANHKMMGSPINISNSILDIKFDTFYNLLMEYMKKYKESA